MHHHALTLLVFSIHSKLDVVETLGSGV
jgi:hypothetical protein